MNKKNSEYIQKYSGKKHKNLKAFWAVLVHVSNIL